MPRGSGALSGVRGARAVLLALACWAVFLGTSADAAEERRNWFNDPFAPATQGLPACPAPEGPLLTAEEQRSQAHQRAERGTRCYMEKKCEEPNAYRYDARINAAVVSRLAAEPQLARSSLWVTTQRRFVFVQGCITARAQQALLHKIVAATPEVEQVIVQTMVGTRGAPPYRPAASPSPAWSAPR